MRRIFFFLIVVLLHACCFAQKQTYDVLSYNLPKGWQQNEVTGSKQLTFTDKKTGEYAIALLVKSAASDGPAADNFINYWNRLVKGSVKVFGEPAMSGKGADNGWEILSGFGRYADGADTGTVTLLSASGGGRATAVVLMTNTNKYQAALEELINSFELSNVAKTSSSTFPFTGLWADYAVERNAYQQYTTGYLRKEYQFNPDGTYTFRKKNFMTNSNEIYFVSETGTYSVSGNRLTITPGQGKTEFWEKAKSLKNDEWGIFSRSEKHKLETVTYTFELLEDPNYGNSIILKPGKATVRDGGQFNAADDPYKFHYTQRKLGSLIDNPPGKK